MSVVMVSNTLTDASTADMVVSKRLMELSNSPNLLSTSMEVVPIIRSPPIVTSLLISVFPLFPMVKTSLSPSMNTAISWELVSYCRTISAGPVPSFEISKMSVILTSV